MANGKKQQPRSGAGRDRFIPVRNNEQLQVASFLIAKKNSDVEEAPSSFSLKKQKAWSVVMNGFDIEKAKILHMGGKALNAVHGYHEVGDRKVPRTRSPTKSRHISLVPEIVLDAPELRNDFYLNLMDWGKRNVLAVALEDCVYLWDAKLEETVLLKEMEELNGYITSVSWSDGGNFLAIGTSECKVELWDVPAQKRLRSLLGHRARVSSLSWNDHILLSGSRSGLIHHYDVRVADHHLATLRGHTQEVCGLTWSPSGNYLASGGDDNLVNVWPSVQGGSQQVMRSFSEHRGAVKALAWCSWRPSILASGGATRDNHIRTWNINDGSCVTSWDTHSQVSSLVFAPNYQELVSGHGFTPETINIWEYPSLTKVAKLKGHKGRVLNMALSPDGSTLESVGSDKVVQLWNCFEREPTSKPVFETQRPPAAHSLK